VNICICFIGIVMLLMRTAIVLSAVTMLIEGEATADPVLRLIAAKWQSRPPHCR